MQTQKIVILFALTLFCLACVGLSGSDEKYPYNLMLSLKDLPDGYEETERSSDYDLDLGGEIYVIAFKHNNEMFGQAVTQQFIAYSNEKLAKDYLAIWENHWLTNDWTPPAKMTFQPASKNDQMIFRCKTIQISNKLALNCGVLQRHNNLITMLVANVDEESLTAAQFEKLLQTLDDHLNTESK